MPVNEQRPPDDMGGGPRQRQHQRQHQQPPPPQLQQTSIGRSRDQTTNQRFSNLIHDSELFLTRLREFKPQSLGCLEARRKSSSTLIFPSPSQACQGPPKCPRYPHNVKPTSGYWIECHGPGPAGQSQGAAASALALTASAGTASGVAASTTSAAATIIGAKSDEQTSGRASSLAQDPLESGLESSAGGAVSKTPGAMATSEGQAGRDLMGAPGLSPARRGPSHERGEHQALCMVASTSLQQLVEPAAADQAGGDPSGGCASKAGGGGGGGEFQHSGGSVRKKATRRTMTRDDIDLHKSRRGTPNITITEPSFNQSMNSPFSPQPTVSSGSPSAAGQRGPGSTSSHSQTGNEMEDPASPSDELTQRSAFKYKLARNSSMDEGGAASEAGRQRASDALERQDSAGSACGEFGGADSNRVHHFRHHQLHEQAGQVYIRHHQRPSIICEDLDGGDLERAARSKQAAEQDNELYCGLSTTEFTRQQQASSTRGSVKLHEPDAGQLATGTSCGEDSNQLLQRQESAEQFRDSSLELISFEEENYEKHYYGREHWNYFTNDELLGPVMLSLKQEVNNQRDHFHVLLRTVSYTLHGTIPASTICADRYDREAIVRELSEIAKLKPPLMLGQLPSTPDELLKLDHIFIKTELKVGVIYIKQGQEESEEAILGNREESPLFAEFLDLLGDRITLKGFDRYKGGLDTVHNLTGTESVYTMWRNIEIMFHVSTMLPHEENDPQKLQKKRHIGNDIVCVAFIESDNTLFWPGCIKSYFLHTFIAVQTSPKPLKAGELRKYSVSCVCRNEVQYAFRPYLVERDEFFKSDYFREWLLVKIVNGERASYSAPKFARMQDRTRSQLLEDIITNLANHLVTGQIPKPYRRGSWRPLGHTRASSPLEDSMKDYFEDYDQLAKDFCAAFCGPNKSVLCDVAFKVKDADGSFRLVHGVRAIMAIRSRTFLEMLYGFVPPGASSTGLQSQTNLRAIEMKALSGETSIGAATGGALKDSNVAAGGEPHSKGLLTKRGSVGTDPGRRVGEKERRQSMLPNLSKSVSQKANYLTVPNAATGGAAGAAGTGGGAGAGGMIKNAFNRLVSGNWSGWSGVKGYKGEPMHIKVDQNKTKVDLNSLAICKEIAKIDSDKLAQTEFEIKEFDYETFQQTIEYIHNGQCKLSYETIPGLICAAEHYDLPDLLHACFHHANTHMRLSAAPKMMNLLYQNSCFYITAMQLLDSIYEYIDPHGNEFFGRSEYLDLYESVFTSLLCRKTLQVNELKKFQAMDGWARRQVANKMQQLQSKQQQQQLKRKESGEQADQRQGVASQQPHQQLSSDQPVGGEQAHQVAATCSSEHQQQANEQMEQQEYRNLMHRLNKDINIKLDKISNEDLVKYVLPTRVFNNEKVFEVMADESRNDY